MPRKPIDKHTYPVVATELDDWIDPDTGEVKRKLMFALPEDEPAGPIRGRPRKGTTRTRITQKRSRRVSQGYAMLDTESMGMLDLSRQEYRVFSFLLSKMDATGEIRVTMTYIARGTGMTRPNVSKTMKSLRERHIVIDHAYGVFRINASIAWVGEWKKWNAAAQLDPEPVWDSAEADREVHLEVVE